MRLAGRVSGREQKYAWERGWLLRRITQRGKRESKENGVRNFRAAQEVNKPIFGHIANEKRWRKSPEFEILRGSVRDLRRLL